MADPYAGEVILLIAVAEDIDIVRISSLGKADQGNPVIIQIP